MLKEIKTNTHHFFVDENGHIQGEYKVYYYNGHLYIHSFYLNGKRHGEYKLYHDNGQLWEHTFFQNDKHHGEYKLYHDNGQLLEHFFFQNGKHHGEYKHYCINGQLRYATFYYQDIDLKVDPDTLSEQDKAYIMISGRLPPRDQPC